MLLLVPLNAFFKLSLWPRDREQCVSFSWMYTCQTRKNQYFHQDSNIHLFKPIDAGVYGAGVVQHGRAKMLYRLAFLVLAYAIKPTNDFCHVILKNKRLFFSTWHYLLKIQRLGRFKLITFLIF